MHDTSAQQMQVEVVHGLTAIISRIDDGTVAAGQTLLTSDFRDRKEQMTQQGTVFRRGVGERADMLARHDEHMHGSVRMNVGEGDALGVLVDPGRGDASVDDLAEQATHNFFSIGPRLSPKGLDFDRFGYSRYADSGIREELYVFSESSPESAHPGLACAGCGLAGRRLLAGSQRRDVEA